MLACRDQLYFDRVHVFAPILQKHRYRSWARKQDKSPQQICLQYAMWTLAASFSSQFHFIRHSLHRDLRELLNALESESQDKQADHYTISIDQVQAWVLLALYELTSDTCDYQRGILSAGRAFRLVQMMRLYEVDKTGVSSPNRHAQTSGDWIAMESMRRTFWLAYTIDRFTSMVDGMHLAFDEQQVRVE